MFKFVAEKIGYIRTLCALFFVVPFLSVSAPIYTFELELTITDIMSPCGPYSDLGPVGFGCDVSIGDKWLGMFQISTDPSSVTESAFSSPFLNMNLQTGNAHWNHCILVSSCSYSQFNLLELYRNYLEEDFSVKGPAFNVSNGEIISIFGGYVGFADATFIDFDISGIGTFAALDITSQYVKGTYAIRRVSEPNVIILMIFCLFLLYAQKQSKRSNRNVRPDPEVDKLTN